MNEEEEEEEEEEEGLFKANALNWRRKVYSKLTQRDCVCGHLVGERM